jgi:hypothetical protein
VKKVFSIILIAFVSISCSKTQEVATPSNLEGNWISKDYQEHIQSNHTPKGVLMDIAFYATELVINQKQFKDSLVVYNGQKERANLPFTRSGDTLKLKINSNEITNFIYSKEDKTLSFIDQKLNRVFRFTRADSSLLDKSYEMPLAFPALINDATITGKYDMLENNGKPQIVNFSKFGIIKGWDKYDNYSLIVNGEDADKFEGDLIYCSNAKGATYFALNATKPDSITFHNVIYDTKTSKFAKSNIQVLLVRRK